MGRRRGIRKRWELGHQAFDNQLVNPLRQRQAVESTLAEVAQAHAIGQSPVRQCLRRLGDEDLAPMSGRSDPRGAIDIDADVIVAAGDSLAAVQAHANADLVA